MIWSYCLGSIDWASALIPSKDIRHNSEDVYNHILERDKEDLEREKEEHDRMHQHIEDVD